MTYNKINDIVDAKDSILELIENDTSFTRPDVLTNSIFIQPFTRVKHLQEVYSENTARKYLDKLVDMHVLEKRMISGNAYYLNLELYRILSE